MWPRLRLPRFRGRPFGKVRERLTTLVGAARDEPIRWPQVAKAAIATAIAWELAEALPGKSPPVFAPLAAMLTIQVTAFESLRSAVQRTSGVVAGVLLAYAFSRFVGLHWWSIALVIFAAMALGQALALGISGSTQVPVSALLVLGLGATTTSYAYARVLETLLGAVIGVIVSVVLVPPLHLRDSGRAVRRLAEGQAELLETIADDLRSGAWPSPVAGRRLAVARGLTGDLARAQEAVERVGDSVRLNPRARRARPAARLYRREVDALSHIQVQVRGIARTLADEAARAGEIERLAGESALTNSGPLLATTVSGSAAVAAAESGALQRRPPEDTSPLQPPPPDLRQELVTVLAQVATALRSFGHAAVDDDNQIGSAAAMHALAQQLPDTRRAVREAIRAARNADLTPGTWLVIGSVLTDLRRILGELEGAREVPVDIPVHRPRRPPPRNPTLRSSFRLDRRRHG